MKAVSLLLIVFGILAVTSDAYNLPKFATAKKNVAKSCAAAMVCAALMFDTDIAHAEASPMDSGTIIAARSGGRAGGRSSYRAPSRSAAPSRGYSSGGYRGGGYRGGTTVIMPMGSPFGYGYGGGFNNFGVGYGLGAAMNGGMGGRGEVRDYKQQIEIENEAQKLEKAEKELAESKAKEAELEQRLSALEAK